MKIDKTRSLDYWYVAKFVAIFGVVIDHSQYFMQSSPWFNLIRFWIFSFFLQVFFFSPGAIDYWKSIPHPIGGFPLRVLHRAEQILVPYCLWCVVLSKSVINLDFWKGILYGTEESLSNAGINSVLWFLPVMFVSSVYYDLVMAMTNKVKEKLKVLLCVGESFLLAGFSDFVCQNFPNLPFGVGISFMGCALMILGYAFQSLWCRFERLSKPLKRLAVLFFFILSVDLAFIGCPVTLNNEEVVLASKGIWMAHGQFGTHWIVFLAESLVSTSFVLLLSMLLESNTALVFYGKNTLIIMAAHGIVYPAAVRLSGNLFEKELICQIASALLACLLCTPIIAVGRRYLPGLCGHSPSTTIKQQEKQQRRVQHERNKM